MSYIGNNPSIEDLRVTGTLGIRSAKVLNLTVSSTAPGSPAEGMIYYNDGTGTISEGLKVYKNGNFVSLDAQEGDADTLQLLQAKDQPAIKFNAAISSTSVVGNTLPVPIPTSTGTGGVGTFDVPSTGTDALMSNVDASRVFKYISSSTADSKSDYFGVSLAVPKGFRGENIGMQFLYRTVTTSTTAMSDGQFKVFIQDKTNGKSVTSTTTGTVAAGGNIYVSDRTGIGVGDKVFIETGTSAPGNAANDITEAWVTSIDGSTGAGNMTVSQTVTLPGTAGARVITKLLSGLTVGELDAAPSTAGSGKMKKIQFTPESTCAEIYVWFQNTASTGSTKVDTLFFDQFLITANKFLQVESNINPESFIGGNFSLYSTSNGRIPNIQTTTLNTGNKFFTFESDSTNGAKFTILRDCIVSADMTFQIASTGTGEYFGWSKNSTQLGTNILSITAGNIIALEDPRGNVATTIGFTRRMAKGDVIRPHGGNTSGTYTNSANWHCYFNASPIERESIVVESEDEIFSDWTAYTPTLTGFGTGSNVSFKWRRVGDEMEIKGFFTSGTSTATAAKISLPSGYSIDTNKCDATSARDIFGVFGVMTSSAQHWSNTNGAMGFVTRSTSDVDVLYLSVSNANQTTVTLSDGNGVLSSGDSLTFQAKVPIVGWSAKFNPVLSMPLADYSEFQNTYSARVTNTGTTSAITSQSGNFIASSTRTGTNGAINIVWTSGFFTVAPSVVVSVDGQTGNSFAMVSAISSTGCTINADEDGGANPDRNMNLTVTRQGADYREVPQATAAIIKPSVCFVKDVKGNSVAGGATGTANAWHDRTLNTLEGESWFVNSLSSNVITLPAGQYEIEAVQNMSSSIDTWTTRLYNTTDSKTLAAGTTQLMAAQTSYPDSHVKWSGTFAKATGIKLQYIVETAGTASNSLGIAANGSGTNSTESSIYSQMKITKLK